MIKIILLFLLFFSLSYSQKLQKIKLQFQGKDQAIFAGFYIAKEKGFYKNVGLDLEFTKSKKGIDIVDEVIKGNADFGLSFSSLVIDYIKNKPIVLVANFIKLSPLVLVTKQNLKNKEEMPIPIFTINEIYTLNKLGIKYNILNPASYGTNFYDLNLFTTRKKVKNNPTIVEKMRKISMRGWKYVFKHKNEVTNLIYKKYNPKNKSKKAILLEINKIEHLMLTNIYPIGNIDLEKIKNITEIFTQSSLLANKNKLQDFVYTPSLTTILMNKKQKVYLKNKKKIKMCVDPHWVPLEKIEEGKYIGIGADIMKIISQKINTPIELVITDNWTQSLMKIKNRECDILPLSEESPQRKKYLNYTKPYISLPLVIVTKTGIPFISNFSNIKNKKLAVVKGYSMIELLKQKYPNINLVEVNDIEDGLEQIEEEKVFGLLDNAIVINHYIQKNYLTDISINGQFKINYSLRIASRNDEKELNIIMGNALSSIKQEDIFKIINKWTNINYKMQTNYKLLVEITFVTFVLVLIFIYWNLKLKDEIKKKENIQEQLKNSEEKFRTFFDIAPILINAFDKKGKIILWNKECERVFGWKRKEIVKIENPLSLFYPKKEDQEKVLDSLKNIQYNIYQEWHPQTKKGKKIITMWANIKVQNNEVINVGYDITKQKAYEVSIKEKTKQLALTKKQLEELNNSLEEKIETEIEKNTKHQMILMQQSKLAQMGEMIENIAHQWRQPLAQINSSILLIDSALEKNKFENTVVDNKLLEIESLTSYMSKTIDDFKNFFDPNKQKKIFKIENTIFKAHSIIKGTLKLKKINIIKNIDNNLECKSYENELQQVILTLLNNAIDALVTMNIKSPKINISAYKISDEILITIEDNAIGIKEEYLDKIFQPYFTTKHKSQGTGLGLYMAKLIVEDGLKGTLSVKNKQKGASFTIKIKKGFI